MGKTIVDRPREADAIEAEMPDGIQWPRFEDGELVKFGDEFVSWDGETHKVRSISIYHPDAYPDYAINEDSYHNYIGGKKSIYNKFVKRPEPEVLDADGVPIKVGDTVYVVGGGVPEDVRKIQLRQGCGTYEVLTDYIEDGDMGYLPEKLTHRKPDTQEDIDADATIPPRNYYAERIGHDGGLKDDEEIYTAVMRDLLRRQRKLMGGE